MLFRKKKEEAEVERDTEIAAYRASIEALQGIADGNEALARRLTESHVKLEEKYRALGDERDRARQQAQQSNRERAQAESKLEAERLVHANRVNEIRESRERAGQLEQAGIGLANELRRLQNLLAANGIDPAKPSGRQAPKSYGGWPGQGQSPNMQSGDALRDEILRARQAQQQADLRRARQAQQDYDAAAQAASQPDPFNQQASYTYATKSGQQYVPPDSADFLWRDAISQMRSGRPTAGRPSQPPPPLNPWANLTKEERLAFDTLGCLPGDDVKKAYREAAAKNHPDQGGSNAEMVKVNKAWDLLKEKVK